MKLRSYQEKLVSAVMNDLRQTPNVLVQAATGAGKTIMFAEIIKRYISQYPKMKILIIVHREIIVRQNADKLLSIWPGAPIGIVCASVSQKKNFEPPIIFASVQTLASKKVMEQLPYFHLVIIDEVHRLPPKNSNSQYLTVLNRLHEYNIKLRLLGFTATPYRLSWGYIYGKKHKRRSDDEACQNWFEKLNYSIGITELQNIGIDDENQDAPYLCGMRAYVAEDIEADLDSVKTTAGEYNQKELNQVMQKTVHLQSALDAYQKYSLGRTRCVIFAVDIIHAETLLKVFRGAGYIADCVHSKREKSENRKILSDFDAGLIQIVINVGVLTEGWDCSSVDMLMLCRPTKSAALFVQMVGRGLRTFPGKKDVIILDLANCFNSHGHPADPILPNYSEPGKAREPKIQVDPECPRCGFSNPPKTICCTNCGEILQIRQYIEAKKTKLREINLDAIQKQKISEDAEIQAIIDKIAFSSHITKDENECVKVQFNLKLSENGNMTTYCLHFYRLDGAARFFFNRFMFRFFGIAAFELNFDNVSETVKYLNNINIEPYIGQVVAIYKENKYWKVKGI